MSGYGFGICGHKNEYSNGVLCGNWSQDQKYKDVCMTPIKNNKSKVAIPSEKILNNSAPRHDIQYLSGKEIARKNQMSLSYSSLFGHSGSCSSSYDEEAGRFLTVNQISYGKTGEGTTNNRNNNDGKMKNNLASEKSKNEYNTVRIARGEYACPIPDFRKRKVQILMSSGSICQ